MRDLIDDFNLKYKTFASPKRLPGWRASGAHGAPYRPRTLEALAIAKGKPGPVAAATPDGA